GSSCDLTLRHRLAQSTPNPLSLPRFGGHRSKGGYGVDHGLSCPIFLDQNQVEDFASFFPAATLTVRANSTGVRFPIEECGLSSLYSRRQAASFRRASTKFKNSSPLRHSSRSLPLKLSMKPFSIGRPGPDEVQLHAPAISPL